MREIYLNITYECNSNCLFCASEHDILKQCGRMDYEEIVSSLERINIGVGDEIIINGGEPTIHKDLIKILKYIKQKKASVILFTNGRAFKSIEFLKSVNECGLSQISIPIHGNMEIHDRITCVEGSYNETIEGINNISKLSKNKHTLIELKIVLCRSNIKIVPSVIKKILSFNVADRILISALFQTELVKRNNEVVLPHESVAIVSSIINIMKNTFYNGNIILYGIPLCMLEEDDIEYIINKNEKKSKLVGEEFEEIYIDYKRKGECAKELNKGKCKMKFCKYQNYCEVGDTKNIEMYSEFLTPFV